MNETYFFLPKISIDHQLKCKENLNAIYTEDGTWYNEASNIIELKHYPHSLVKKNIMKELIQYLKDSIESFDHYYLGMQKEFNLFHIY